MDNRNSKLEFLKSNFWELLFSIPKTIYFNFSILPFGKAVKLPIIVSYHVKLKGVNRKSFIYDSLSYSFASSRIGLGASRFSARENKSSLINIDSGVIVLKGNAGLCQGIILDATNGRIELGEHFRCNYSTTISAVDDDIVIGDEVVLGWKVNIKNNDGHYIIVDGETKKNHGPIHIGNHVWICAETTIMKNVSIGDECVVAYGSLLSKTDKIEDNALFAGIPARVIKNNIDWVE